MLRCSVLILVYVPADVSTFELWGLLKVGGFLALATRATIARWISVLQHSSMAQTNGRSPDALSRTAYLGPEASFSHQAAVDAILGTQPIPLPSFKAILSALQQSHAHSEAQYDYAVLPVENSTNGSVVQALDLLAQCRLDPISSAFPDIEIVDEHYLEVHHCMFVSRVWAEQRLSKEDFALLESSPNGTSDRKKLEQLLTTLNIKTLYSHPQVWGQCNNILSALLPPGHVDRVDTSSTSAAAAYVVNHPSNISEGDEESGTAAISSSLAGAKHGRDLVCLASNIEDDPGSNTTRFLVLQNRLRRHSRSPPSGSSEAQPQVKSLFTFTMSHHVPGSLAKILAVFAKYDFNLSAIQSRPKPKTKAGIESKSVIAERNSQASKWEYVFFVECLHPQLESKAEASGGGLEELSNGLRTVTEQLSHLGSWYDRLCQSNSVWDRLWRARARLLQDVFETRIWPHMDSTCCRHVKATNYGSWLPGISKLEHFRVMTPATQIKWDALCLTIHRSHFAYLKWRQQLIMVKKKEHLT